MKRLAILFLSFALSLNAQIGGNASSGGNFSTGGNVQAAQSAGNSYIVQQDFESAGTPSGWTSFSGSPTFHNTTSPLEGTGDLLETGTGVDAYVQFSAQTEIWAVFMFKANTYPASSTTTCTFDDSGFVHQMLLLQVNSSGIKGLMNGTQFATSSGGVSNGQLYHVKMHYNPGTKVEIEFSTGDFLGNNGNGLYISSTTSVPSQSVTDVEFQGAGGNTFQFDHVRISTTDYGLAWSSWN